MLTKTTLLIIILYYTIIPVIGHNEIADICYSRLRKYDNIYVYGLINSIGQIEIREIYF